MNTKTIISSVLAVSLLSSTFAFARDYRDDNQPFPAPVFGQGVNVLPAPIQVAQAGWPDQRRILDNRGAPHRFHRWNRGHERMIYEPYPPVVSPGYGGLPGYGGVPSGYGGIGWQLGDVLPAQYLGDNYVVKDWRYYHLNPPPYGYRWIRADGDFILASIATGIISQIIWNSLR